MNCSGATSRRLYLHPIYLPYPVKYFAARDRAPAPNTLAAALLPSSFRNKRFCFIFLLLRHIGLIDRGDQFLQCLRNHLLLPSARCDRRFSLRGDGGSSALIDRDPDWGRGASFAFPSGRSRNGPGKLGSYLNIQHLSDFS